MIRKLTEKVVKLLECPGVPVGYYILSFVFIVLIRNFSEQFATGQDLKLLQVFTYSPFYFALAAWFIIIFSWIGKIKPLEAARVVLPAFIIIWIPPLLDLLITWGGPVRMKYIAVLGWNDLFVKYFTGIWDFSNNAQSIGQRVEIIIAAVISFLYFYMRTGRLMRSLTGFWLIYTSLFVFGLIASFSVLPFQWMDIPRGNDVLFFPRIYFLVTLVFLLILFFIQNRLYFITLFKDMRFERLTHYFILLALGYALYLRNNELELIPLDSDNIMIFLMTPVSIIFSALFTIMSNNLFDKQADRISQPQRPTITGVIPEKTYRKLMWISLMVSLTAALLTNRTVFILILAGTGVYYLYSVPPLRLKRIPVVAKLLVGLSSWLMVLLGFSAFGAPVLGFPADYTFFLLIPFALAGNFIDLKDFEGDRQAGLKTLPVLLGLRGAKMLIAVFLAASYVTIWWILRQYNLPLWLEYGPFFLGALHIPMLFLRKYREWPLVLFYILGLLALLLILLIKV